MSSWLVELSSFGSKRITFDIELGESFVIK